MEIKHLGYRTDTHEQHLHTHRLSVNRVESEGSDRILLHRFHFDRCAIK